MGRLALFLAPFAKIQIAQIMIKFTWQKRALLENKRRGKKKKKKEKISSIRSIRTEISKSTRSV